MVTNGIRAKIFLSCGQRTEYERKTANDLAKELNDLGFDTYIAIKQQSLSSLRENIYKQLETSDYYLFIDFKREKLCNIDHNRLLSKVIFSKNLEYRGSLFAHQELAIASFINLPILAFQEEGIKKLDGLMNALQVNSYTFTQSTHLLEYIISTVKEKLQTGEWATDWKSSITAICDNEFYEDTYDYSTKETLRVFHIGVCNNHRYKPLINGSVLLERILVINSNLIIPIETVETKWKGSQYPYITIAPNSIRKFDAILILKTQPEIMHFHILTDYGGYSIKVETREPILATFRITSSNFPCLLITIKIDATMGIEKTKIDLISEEYIMPSI